MLKLLKYEFRRARFMLFVLAAVVAGLEAYFLISLDLEKDGNIIASWVLLLLACFAGGIAIFISGITTYSSELKNKTSYLIFMTPNSTLAVITAKMLYAVITSAVAVVITLFIIRYDAVQIMIKYDVYIDFVESITDMLEEITSVDLATISIEILAAGIGAILDVVRYLVTAYLAITLSATFMKEMRARGFVTFIIYIAINVGATALTNALTAITIFSQADYLYILLIPSIGVSLLATVISLLGSAWMLEKKVSL